MTLGRLWVDFELTLGRRWVDFGVAFELPLDEFELTLARLWIDFGLTFGRLWVDLWMTVAGYTRKPTENK